MVSKIDTECEYGWTESEEVWNHFKQYKAHSSKHQINKNTKVIYMYPGKVEVEAMPHSQDHEYSFSALDHWVHHMLNPNIHE